MASEDKRVITFTVVFYVLLWLKVFAVLTIILNLY
jgi:hypothetical protein